MQISPANSLIVSSAFTPERQPTKSNPPQATADALIQHNSARAQAVPLQRQPVFAQPLFNQSLTHRGEQASRLYQEIELGGETELMNRLDEIA